jgi:hypothetical protein
MLKKSDKAQLCRSSSAYLSLLLVWLRRAYYKREGAMLVFHLHPGKKAVTNPPSQRKECIFAGEHPRKTKENTHGSMSTMWQ